MSQKERKDGGREGEYIKHSTVLSESSSFSGSFYTPKIGISCIPSQLLYPVSCWHFHTVVSAPGSCIPQSTKSVYLPQSTKSNSLFVCLPQSTKSDCLSVCVGGWICLSLSLSHHTHTRTHIYFFNSILISPCLPLGTYLLFFKSLGSTSWHWVTAWFGESSSTITSPGTTQEARHLGHSLSYTGCFLSCQIFPPLDLLWWPFPQATNHLLSLALFFQALVIEPQTASCMWNMCSTTELPPASFAPLNILHVPLLFSLFYFARDGAQGLTHTRQVSYHWATPISLNIFPNVYCWKSELTENTHNIGW